MEALELETQLLRAEQVARVLGIGRWKVFEMVARGELPVVRIGRLVRVPRPALARWIADHTEEGHRDVHVVTERSI
jgi:excisionase family DNA binding protein